MSQPKAVSITISVSTSDNSFKSELSFPVSLSKEEIESLVKNFAEMAFAVLKIDK